MITNIDVVDITVEFIKAEYGMVLKSLSCPYGYGIDQRIIDAYMEVFYSMGLQNNDIVTWTMQCIKF